MNINKIWQNGTGYINPVLKAMNGFKYPYMLHCIVQEGYGMNDFNYCLKPNEIKFFGYKEQCEKHLNEYPNCFILDNLENRIML